MTYPAFYPLLANTFNYPKSRIPILPVFSYEYLKFDRHACEQSAFFTGGEFFTHGRYALAEAIQRANSDKNGAVLLPSFHCRSMVEPALYHEAKIYFYPVLNDLRPDYTALELILQRKNIRPTVFVLPHYFGFPNSIKEARQFCIEHDIILIEDCAHAFYGVSDAQQLGTIGNYAITSIWKFHPARDGAVLLDNSNRGRDAANRLQQSWLAETKSLYMLLRKWGERKFNSNNILREIDPLLTLDQAYQMMQIKIENDRDDKRKLKYFLPEKLKFSGLRSSYWLMKWSAHTKIIHQRRENYLKWLDGVQSIPGISPLFPRLPEGVAPYAFPLLADSEGLTFHLLKLAGISIWRWEDMALTDCSVSRDYRFRLLQLPCHQGLKQEELDWMINTLRSVILGINQ